MKKIVVAAAMSLIAGGYGSAAYAGVKDGQIEASVFGQFSNPDEGDGNSFFGAGLGISVGPFILKADISGFESEGNLTGGLGLGGDFLLGTAESTLVPFVGASYEMGIGDDTEAADGSGSEPPPDFYNVRGGIKTFLSERVALELQIRRHVAVKKEFDTLDSTDMVLALNVYLGN